MVKQINLYDKIKKGFYLFVKQVRFGKLRDVENEYKNFNIY